MSKVIQTSARHGEIFQLVQALLSFLKKSAASAAKDRGARIKALFHRAGVFARDLGKKIDAMEWKAKMRLLLAAICIILFIIGPVFLSIRFTERLRTQAMEKGSILAQLLAASNRAAFKDKQDVLFSVEAVSKESGVTGAYVTDIDGEIVAPVDLFGKQIRDITGFGSRLYRQVGDTLKIYRMRGGDYLFTYPVQNFTENSGGIERETDGVACVRYDAGAYGWWYAWVEILKYLVLAAFISLGAYYLLCRWTLLPMKHLAHHANPDTAALKGPHFSGIRFDELQKVCEACSDTVKNHSHAVSSNTPDASQLWEGLAALGFGGALVMDADKRVLSVGRDIEQIFKCRFEQGEHILDHAIQKQSLNALMQLVVRMDEKRNQKAETALDAAHTLKGICVGEGMSGIYIVAVDKKRGREGLRRDN